MKKFKIGICQLKTTENKLSNISKAHSMLREAKKQGADVCILGEMFSCPYNNHMFQPYSESLADLPLKSGQDFLETSKCPSIEFLREASRELGILLIGGSVPESRDGLLYNTCFVFDQGDLIASHSKTHLFDIDIPGKTTFKESDTLAPGNTVSVVKTRFGVFGLGICYDIRFCDYAMAMRKLGAEVLFYPSVFNMVTGPTYFWPTGTARALDTQCYVVLGSNARYVENTTYTQCWGHSAVFDCTGKLIDSLDEKEGIILQDIDLELVAETRRNLPFTSAQIRTDLYNLKVKGLDM